MFKKKIIPLALVGILTVAGTSVSAFAMEPATAYEMPTIDFAADPDSSQEQRLAVLTKIMAEYNPDLHAELVSIVAEHDQFHHDATTSQEAHQTERELDVSAIVESSKAGEITKADAKQALDTIKAETTETIAGLQSIKAEKTQEDGQLKASTKAIGDEIIAQFSSGNPDTDILNQLFAEFIENQRIHLEIDYKYQAQIDALLGTI